MSTGGLEQGAGSPCRYNVINILVCDQLLCVTCAYLQHDLLHLLVGRLELPHQDEHHLLGVVVGVLGVHEGDEVPDGLQEGSQSLAPVSK